MKHNMIEALAQGIGYPSQSMIKYNTEIEDKFRKYIIYSL